jgi:hypothetical protein
MQLSPDTNTEELKDIIQKYPYFSLPYYYLLRQTNEGAAEYSQIAGKTALHFNNPYYLQYLINKKENDVVLVSTDIPSPESTGRKPELPEQPVEKEAPLFEPLYTTDYFASQGIKLSEEVKADDKLGKQLRSFTDWLKTMKKLHEQKLPPGSEQIDLSVQNIAEKSNTEAEVLTESMAEVYIAQGKTEKAREIYDKLSLLDPSKSAYFAAKSEFLKQK